MTSEQDKLPFQCGFANCDKPGRAWCKQRQIWEDGEVVAERWACDDHIETMELLVESRHGDLLWYLQRKGVL